jgi:fructose-1,6-bisphosphatase/sedoheptulose 1,7-bisphosphatase-like protein
MVPRETKELVLPERLQTEIEKVAHAQERPVNEVLAEAVDRYIKEKQWLSLKRYGREKARERGIGEGDVDRLIAESRANLSR